MMVTGTAITTNDLSHLGRSFAVKTNPEISMELLTESQTENVQNLVERNERWLAIQYVRDLLQCDFLMAMEVADVACPEVSR